MKMPIAVLATLLVSLFLCVPVAEARDDAHFLPVKDALELGKAQGKLDGSVRFYFSGQSHPAVSARLRTGVMSNKKTNAANKSDEEACQWAMLTALIAFQDRVKREGGNAVINLESYYNRRSYKNATQYECHAGTWTAGVVLKGDVVRLGN